MENLSIETFNPTEVSLRGLSEKAKAIKDIANPEDKEQIKEVKAVRIELRDARIAIEKHGKKLREDAIVFQKAVITKERALIAIIKPDEEALSGIEEAAEKIAEMKIRMAILPERKKVLSDLGIEASDEELLSVNDAGFVDLKNTKITEKNRLELEKLDIERKKIEEEKEKIEAEKKKIEDERRRSQELLLAEERAREKEREKIEREIKEAEEQKIRDEQDRIEREIEDKKKLEKQKKYRKFREEFGWTEVNKDEFREEKIGDRIVLWKKMGEFDLK